MKDLQTAPESLFWYWINERHSIYLRRQTGQPKPWTEDPILQAYKFTNAFRELDRGTVWLRENFLEPHRDADAGLLLFNIAWYRMFNWVGTGHRLGWRTEWEPETIKSVLRFAADTHQQVFTNAHIVWSEEGMSKIDAIVDYATAVWKQRDFLVGVCTGNSLERFFDAMITYRGIGGFIAYEIVSDVRHTRLLDHATDIMTWANPGPGAIRGLRRLGLPHKPRAQAIDSMRLLLSRSCRSDNLPIPEEWPHIPDLEMRDIEHSLCEFDKYCRVKFGEGEPRMKFAGV